MTEEKHTINLDIITQEHRDSFDQFNKSLDGYSSKVGNVAIQQITIEQGGVGPNRLQRAMQLAAFVGAGTMVGRLPGKVKTPMTRGLVQSANNVRQKLNGNLISGPVAPFKMPKQQPGGFNTPGIQGQRVPTQSTGFNKEGIQSSTSARRLSAPPSPNPLQIQRIKRVEAEQIMPQRTPFQTMKQLKEELRLRNTGSSVSREEAAAAYKRFLESPAGAQSEAETLLKNMKMFKNNGGQVQ